MFEQLEELEQQARQLDPASDVIDAWMAELGDFTQRYLAELNKQSASAEQDVGPIWNKFKEEGETFSKALALLQRHVLSSGFNASSGRFMGYVPGGGIPTAAIGDFLAALTNRYAGVYAASPGAGEIENECLRWMRDLVGYPASAWGTLQSGGTLATLTALVAARDTRPADEWPRGVAYATSETHHAFQKCLKIIGLGSMKVSLVATDEAHRMSVAPLKAQIAADRQAGLVPWMVCISAGTTNTGAVDPIEDLLAVAHDEGLWGHVDAAYGGFFLLTERGKKLMRGISGANSIVLDPHKGLFLPYGCGAVLVKDGAMLRNAFASSADYLADVEGQGGHSASDYSPEGTRHFRGLRLWLSLTVNGLANYRAALEEKLLLAQYAYERLRTIEGIEVAPQPELSCVAFRAASNDATKALLDRMVKSRKVYASSTRIDGSLYIRFCILNFRTHREHVDQALAEVAI